jgi:uncharacterized membrane protein YebE (DUF533 family)
VRSPEQAAEVYAASALMVEPPSAAEEIYLDMLANALGWSSKCMRHCRPIA